MSQRSAKFLKKHNIAPQDIRYIVREEGSTVIYLEGREEVNTYIPFKEFEEVLPEDLFIHPNKGVLIAVSYIASIQEGAYETKDGKIFRYRKNNSTLHDKRLMKVAYSIEHGQTDHDEEKLHIFDHVPMPVYALKMDFDEENIQANFTFCYCNQAMSDFERIPANQMIGHSVKEIFHHLEMKWYIDFADVALNNTIKIIEGTDINAEKKIKVVCFQPYKGCCACEIVEII